MCSFLLSASILLAFIYSLLLSPTAQIIRPLACYYLHETPLTLFAQLQVSRQSDVFAFIHFNSLGNIIPQFHQEPSVSLSSVYVGLSLGLYPLHERNMYP